MTERESDRPLVFLFKTPKSAEAADDPYNVTLREGGFKPVFVPVLREMYHTAPLATILEKGDTWEGVVMSSKRGAEGWIRAAESLKNGKNHKDPQGRVLIVDPGPEGWSEVPLWTVGTTALEALEEAEREGRVGRSYIPAGSSGRTAKAAAHLVPLLLSAPPRSAAVGCNDGALDAGQSSQEGVDARESETSWGPYLVLRGDKSIDEIPQALRHHGRETTEVVVYSTEPREDLKHHLDTILNSDEREGRTTWLAFFSPSSAAFVLDQIPPETLEEKGIRIFAIGDTTNKYLQERRLRVDAVADSPSPQGLLDAIARATT